MNAFINGQTKQIIVPDGISQSFRSDVRSEIISICRNQEEDSTFYIFTYSNIIKLDLSYTSLPVFEIIYARKENQENPKYLPRAGMATVNWLRSLYLIGGCFKEAHLFHCDQLDTNTNKWYKRNKINISRSSPGITATENSIYIMGGYGKYSLLRSIEKYENSIWKCLFFSLPLPMSKLGLISVSNNIIIIIGGKDNSAKKYSNDVWEAKIDKGIFNIIGNIPKKEITCNHNIYYKENRLCYMDNDDTFYTIDFEIDKWYDKRIALYLYNNLYFRLI